MGPLGAEYLLPVLYLTGNYDLAFELVDKELLTPEDFRAFVYDNPKRLWTNNRPDFFAGTAIG